MKHLYKIYSSVILGLCLWIIPEMSQATHILGGEIIARATNCQSYTYEIEVRLFRESGSDVELVGNEFYVGHGEPILLYSDNLTLKEPVSYADGQYQVNVFTLRHTYPGPGVYTLYTRIFNRTSAVANMKNSVQTPFYIETQITVDPLIGCNSSANFNSLPNLLAYAKSSYEQLLDAEDADGDSLSYEFITPRQSPDLEVEGYLLPDDFDIRFAPQPTSSSGDSAPELFVSQQGELVWDAPNLGGEFALALRVNEWRKVDDEWVKIGYVTRDMTLRVLDTLDNTQATNYITSTQEEIVTQPKVNIYPNPTPGPFTVEITEDQWLGRITTQGVTTRPTELSREDSS